MAEINAKVVKKEGFNKGNEKQEITIELSGTLKLTNMAEINAKVVKKEGFNKGNEKQEITIELSGTLTVYGEESKEDFKRELRTLVELYAI